MVQMGDLSVEPSMEEILSSIKRIIAEEGEAPGRGRRAPARTAQPSAVSSAVDEVLELSDPMPATPAAAELTRRAAAIEASVAAGRSPAAEPADPVGTPAAGWADALRSPEETPMRSRAAATPAPEAEPTVPAPTATEEPIVSARTADASRGALDSLSKLVVKPEAGGDGTLEGLVREMLRPMLRDWLDRNLPPMVETMVAKEIARITQARG